MNRLIIIHNGYRTSVQINISRTTNLSIIKFSSLDLNLSDTTFRLGKTLLTLHFISKNHLKSIMEKDIDNEARVILNFVAPDRASWWWRFGDMGGYPEIRRTAILI